MGRAGAILGSVAVAAALAAATAKADGLPVLGVNVGSVGVAARAGDLRYVTLDAGRGTIVAAVRQRGGQVERSRLLHGRFTVPAVAYDGSASGLSADGRTLVLIRPRVSFPQAQTVLAVVDTGHMQVKRIVTLNGDFSFDAVSPSGASLYLIQYVEPRDPTRYAVRAYDLRAGRLLSRPVVDPREPNERMRGQPVTRATSADGRWAYTLYDGAGKYPFLHALDTRGRTARCIDLSALASRARNLYTLRLAVSRDGNAVSVNNSVEAIATINTRSFRVSLPDAAGADGHGFGGVVWGLAAVGGVAALAAAAVLTLGRRRRKLAVT